MFYTKIKYNKIIKMSGQETPPDFDPALSDVHNAIRESRMGQSWRQRAFELIDTLTYLGCIKSRH